MKALVCLYGTEEGINNVVEVKQSEHTDVLYAALVIDEPKFLDSKEYRDRVGMELTTAIKKGIENEKKNSGLHS